jgi:hypothetical protein
MSPRASRARSAAARVTRVGGRLLGPRGGAGPARCAARRRAQGPDRRRARAGVPPGAARAGRRQPGPLPATVRHAGAAPACLRGQGKTTLPYILLAGASRSRRAPCGGWGGSSMRRSAELPAAERAAYARAVAPDAREGLPEAPADRRGLLPARCDRAGGGGGGRARRSGGGCARGGRPVQEKKEAKRAHVKRCHISGVMSSCGTAWLRACLIRAPGPGSGCAGAAQCQAEGGTCACI